MVYPQGDPPDQITGRVLRSSQDDFLFKYLLECGATQSDGWSGFIGRIRDVSARVSDRIAVCESPVTLLKKLKSRLDT